MLQYVGAGEAHHQPAQRDHQQPRPIDGRGMDSRMTAATMISTEMPSSVTPLMSAARISSR